MFLFLFASFFWVCDPNEKKKNKETTCICSADGANAADLIPCYEGYCGSDGLCGNAFSKQI